MAIYYTGDFPKQTLNLKEHKKTVSTLRVPLILRKTFERGIEQHGNLPKYFAYLVKKYRFLFYAHGIPFSHNVKTEYQERGTKIFIKTFRPELRDWLEMGMWAKALNYSICKLFVILLWFEEKYDFNQDDWIGGEFLRPLYVSLIVTTPHNFRVPRLLMILRKGRSTLERGISFYEPPD